MFSLFLRLKLITKSRWNSPFISLVELLVLFFPFIFVDVFSVGGELLVLLG